MGRIFPLVWRYLVFHKGKSLILTVCLAAVLFLPLATHLLVGMLEDEMVRRGESTPVVVGAKGSRLDLVLHALYFHTEAPGIIPQSERFAMTGNRDVTAIPLHVHYRARGNPIVGTSLAYFEFRGLEIAVGGQMTRLGDCVVGAEVAEKLGLEPGDRLFSDPENVFDPGGSHPLDMRVTGVLERSHGPDDRVVFVDVRTAWIIEGLGHGHEDVAEEDVSEVLEDGERRSVLASPALATHTRITPENIHTFHFHGDPGEYPLTAIIAVPEDEKARALLLGDYVGDEGMYQALRPQLVIEELMGLVIQLRRFFDMQHMFMVGVTVLLVVLVTLLSLRLRRREMDTMFYIGCSRFTIFRLLAAEWLILLVLSAVLAVAGAWVAMEFARDWIRTLTG